MVPLCGKRGTLVKLRRACGGTNRLVVYRQGCPAMSYSGISRWVPSEIFET